MSTTIEFYVGSEDAIREEILEEIKKQLVDLELGKLTEEKSAPPDGVLSPELELINLILDITLNILAVPVALVAIANIIREAKERVSTNRGMEVKNLPDVHITISHEQNTLKIDAPDTKAAFERYKEEINIFIGGNNE